MGYRPVNESPYVGLGLAGALLSLTPHETRGLALGDEDDPALLRSIVVNCVLMINLRDVLLLAGALADSGLLHRPDAQESPF